MQNKNLDALVTKLNGEGIKKVTGNVAKEVTYQDVLMLAYVPDEQMKKILNLDFVECVTLEKAFNKMRHSGLLKVKSRLVKMPGGTALQLRANRFLRYINGEGFTVIRNPILDILSVKSVFNNDALLPTRELYESNSEYAKALLVACAIDGARNINEFFEVTRCNMQLFTDFINKVGQEMGLFSTNVFTKDSVDELFHRIVYLDYSAKKPFTGKLLINESSGIVYAIVDTNINRLQVITQVENYYPTAIRLDQGFVSRNRKKFSHEIKALFVRASFCLAGICMQYDDWYSLTKLKPVTVLSTSHFSCEEFNKVNHKRRIKNSKS